MGVGNGKARRVQATEIGGASLVFFVAEEWEKRARNEAYAEKILGDYGAASELLLSNFLRGLVREKIIVFRGGRDMLEKWLKRYDLAADFSSYRGVYVVNRRTVQTMELIELPAHFLRNRDSLREFCPFTKEGRVFIQRLTEELNRMLSNIIYGPEPQTVDTDYLPKVKF